MQIELEQTHRNELELKEQIMVLKQDCDVETLYGELLDKMKGKEMQYESSIQKMTLENDSLRGDITSLTKENEAIRRALDGTNAQNTSLTQRLDEANAKRSVLAQRLASVENELDALQRNESRHALNDEVSITSTLASHRLNQTASELDTTIKEIKKHHETTVQNLQTELKEMRSKWKKSDRRVQELSTLLQENSKVIDALHRKLISKKQQRNQTD
jgi:chromosome segregation ATPase